MTEDIHNLIEARRRTMYVDKQGQPLEEQAWLKLISDDDYRVLKQDTLPNGARVSTIWFGLNPPNIFETCVFTADGLADQDRYASEREALDGHGRAIERWLGK